VTKFFFKVTKILFKVTTLWVEIVKIKPCEWNFSKGRLLLNLSSEMTVELTFEKFYLRVKFHVCDRVAMPIKRG